MYMLKLQIKLVERLYALREGEEGQAMVEYALILALVSVIAVGTLATLGTDVDGAFQSIVDEF